MKNFDLLPIEKYYVSRLTDEERRIYMASQEQLTAIATTWNNYHVQSYVEVARLLNELHRMHSRYNELIELYDHEFVKENDIEQLAEDMFCMTISIGRFSTVLNLSNMDECDELYVYLTKVKMNRFDWLCDNFDISVLLATLAFNNCY
jgi:hypothetical protein